MLTEETQFPTVLTFHQALGRGVFAFQEKFKDTVEAIPMKQLLDLLERLAPASAPQSREDFARKIVDMALELKKAMMEELSLYRVFWIDCDVKFDDDLVELVDDTPASKVLLCTFPGLARIDKVDGKEIKHIEVKASARLKSSFEIRV